MTGTALLVLALVGASVKITHPAEKSGSEQAGLTAQYPVETNPIVSTIWIKAHEYGIDPNLAVLLAKHESEFNPAAANSKTSAKGLFQFIDLTWRDYCAGDVFNAEDNADCALRILSEGGLSHWLADPNMEKVLMENCLITPEPDGRIFAECL